MGTNSDIKHANFKKYAEEFFVAEGGEIAVLVGYTDIASGKRKAYPLEIPEGKEQITVYLLQTEVEGVRFGIPKKAKNIASFQGEMKVLDENGLRRILKGDRIYVYEKSGDVFIKVGKNEKEKKNLEQKGI